MKASFKFILAALAATAALVACTKETTPPDFENDKVNPAAEGSRVIAVSFAPQTKTVLDEDGLQPRFVDTDSILISNGVALDTCKVRIDDKTKTATITTKLTGPLTAVYPYTAAGLNGNTIDTVLVSTVQSGTFADANICMAKMKDEKDESLSFENKTAVFRITPMAEDISCLEVITYGIAIANNVPTDSPCGTDKIHVDVPSTNQPKEYFVSILIPEGLTIGNLAFSDGTNVKTVTGDRASEPVAASTIYKVTVTKSFTVTCETVTITGASFSVMKENAAVTAASPGDVLKVEVTCPYGYLTGKITVFKTGDSSTKVEVGTDGSFTMPEYAVTVLVTFELDESGGGTEMEHGGLLG